jgi:multiple sugar transport system substrate-binding protein
MTKFQLIVTGIFGVLIVVGVIIFSSYKGSSGNAVEVAVWGTIPPSTFNDILQASPLYKNKQVKINYVEKSEESFDAEFIEALASGSGPDVFLLPSDKIIKHRNKIFPIPYTAVSERQFKDAFIEGAEIYMAKEGILALPVFADPLVMYWNRSIFNEAKVTQPPKYWDEFYNLANLISQKDGALNILKSAAALGEFANISNAKEIIINLAMQAGTPVTRWEGGKVQAIFSGSLGKPIIPAEAAVNFYTEFGNPAKPSYSWNRSLPNSTNYFLSGDLGLYFGFASEIRSLQLKNPNLNFDVAPMPLSREGGTDVSFARFYGFAIAKSSKKTSAAFSAVSALAGKDAAAAFAKNLDLPPARRDLLGQKASNAYTSVFYSSAIRGKAWLDPSPTETDAIFKLMIESITSGRARTGEAVARVDRELSSLFDK